jgi:hypothetical protein
MFPYRTGWRLLAVTSLLVSGAALADAGDFTGTFSVGTAIFQDKLQTSTQTAAFHALPQYFSPSEFIGAGYAITDRWKVALNLQFTEALVEPTLPANQFTTFCLLPQVAYRFWWDLSVALIGFFPLRYDSVAEAGYGVQGLLGLSVPIAKDLNFTAALEVPFLIQPTTYVGLTPIVGLSYKL